MDADMNTADVFDLAARQASWLLARQSAVAQNVANSSTPGYTAADLQPFEAGLREASLQLAATSPRHIGTGENQAGYTAGAIAAEETETFFSGNDVNLEQEMVKAGEISRAYALNTAIVKAFNAMVLQSAKG